MFQPVATLPSTVVDVAVIFFWKYFGFAFVVAAAAAAAAAYYYCSGNVSAAAVAAAAVVVESIPALTGFKLLPR
jgi:uncharacterized membrane protein